MRIGYPIIFILCVSFMVRAQGLNANISEKELKKFQVLRVEIDFNQDESKIYSEAIVWRERNPVKTGLREREKFTDKPIYILKSVRFDGKVHEKRAFDFIRIKSYMNCKNNEIFGAVPANCKPHHRLRGYAVIRLSWDPNIEKIQIFKGNKLVEEKKVSSSEFVEDGAPIL